MSSGSGKQSKSTSREAHLKNPEFRAHRAPPKKTCIIPSSTALCSAPGMTYSLTPKGLAIPHCVLLNIFGFSFLF